MLVPLRRSPAQRDSGSGPTAGSIVMVAVHRSAPDPPRFYAHDFMKTHIEELTYR
ncbi:hypothetical protein BH23VER1_BH23VER1_36220 [soil metagenome]